MTAVIKSKGILVGSPTVNRGILHSVAGLLEEIRGLGFKKKKAAAFGCYGWSGEAMILINEGLRKAGFEVADDGFRALWNPDEEALNRCLEYGREFAARL